MNTKPKTSRSTSDTLSLSAMKSEVSRAKAIKYYKLALPIAAACLLTACSSGGGSGGNYVPEPWPDPPPAPKPNPTPEPNPEPDPPPEPDPDKDEKPPVKEYIGVPVKVGIADSGFHLSHETISGKVIDTVNFSNDGGRDDVSGNSNHGTGVASIVTQSRADTRLLLAKLTHNMRVPREVINHSVGYLADAGARVINVSYSNRLEAPSQIASHEGIKSIDSLQKITTSNNGLGSLYVVPAGNSGRAIRLNQPIYNNHNDIFQHMLIVGGSKGDDLHPESSFPGDDETLQSRTLVAPMENRVATNSRDDGYTTALGTSFSSPQVAATAAEIMAIWPHMSAVEVGDLLLETSSQESYLFSQNNCGKSGVMNCGSYYFGQGELDKDVAMSPVGELSLPSGNSLSGPSLDLANAGASLSATYGDALRNSDALRNVAVFDGYGRDYQIDLSSNIYERSEQSRRQATRMSRLQQYQAPVSQKMNIGKNWTMVMSQQAFGNEQSMSTNFSNGRYSFGLNRRDGDQINMGLQPTGLKDIGMLSFQEVGGTLENIDELTGIQTSMMIGDRLSFQLNHWTGNESDRLQDDYKANHSNVGISFNLTDNLSLSASVGRTSEQGGVLGAKSNGALSWGESATTDTVSFGFNWGMTPHLDAFAYYEQGSISSDVSNSLVQSALGLKSQEFSAGLVWQDGPHAFAATYRQPQSISAGSLQLSVPVGRTLDGDVIREERNVDMSPSGLQQDFEFGYSLKRGDYSRWQLNTLYSHNPGHDRNADDDWAVLLKYETRF